MEKQYSDQTIKEILSAPIGESDIIDWKMQDAYEKIRKMNKTETLQKKRVIRSIGKGNRGRKKISISGKLERIYFLYYGILCNQSGSLFGSSDRERRKASGIL